MNHEIGIHHHVKFRRGDWSLRRNRKGRIGSGVIAASVASVALCILLSSAAAQNPGTNPEEPSLHLLQAVGSDESPAPVTITLQDALDRARKNDAQYLSAVSDVLSAREDKVQARATLLPSVNYSMQYLGTEGDGKLASGRFVTNDGVHVYRAWGVFHQDLSPGTFMRTALHRATSAEAAAKAKAEIARRGLTVTVTKAYYDFLSSQRKYSTAQQALQQGKHFLDMTQEAERVRQVAHSDVIKADIQYQQQRQAFDEAQLAMENDRLLLAVLLFPTLNENFTAVDDLDAAQVLPQFPEVRGMAERENPELRVAMESLRQSDLDVTTSRNAFLPSLTVDTDYGIEANSFALKAPVAAFRDLGPLPSLGYFVTAALNVPVWNWGTLRSKLHQTELRREQAKVELSKAQREMLGNLYSSYNEAMVARASLETLRHVADLAADSLRLVNLRYQAGESTALEVVDAQNTLTQARNALDDAQVRFRVAIASLQTLTGPF